MDRLDEALQEVNRARNTAFKILRQHPDDIEDALQDARLRVWKNLDGFKGDSALKTWVHRIVATSALMTLRRYRTGVNQLITDVILEPEEDGEETFLENLPDEQAIQGGDIVNKIHIERLLHELPMGYRRVFVLHDIEGYQHNEIAKILKTSSGNSKSQLYKAHEKLRKLMPKIGRHKRNNHVFTSAKGTEAARKRNKLYGNPATPESCKKGGRISGIVNNCNRWNVKRGKNCICGKHAQEMMHS